MGNCVMAGCGDNYVWQGVETCDDNNNVPLDGCEPDCQSTQIELWAAYDRSCMFLPDAQSVRCWGGGGSGALGNNSTTNIGDAPGEMPPPTVNLGGPVVDLVVGGTFNCATLANDELRCWGENEDGQLGHGTVVDFGDSFNEMPPPATNVGGSIAQLVLGNEHACALLDDATVRCWGGNVGGQLGLGHTNSIGDGPGEMPPPAVNLGGPVASLAAGLFHTCALMQNGAVRCWGGNLSGALGLGHVNHIGDGPGEMPPPNVNVGADPILEIVAGYSVTCVLFQNGSVRCWGANAGGQLGQGHNSAIGDGPGEMPPPVTNVGGSVTDIVVGAYTVWALLDDGVLRGWGNGVDGLLAIGNTQVIGELPGEMPPANSNVGGLVSSMAHGQAMGHMCVVLVDTTVRCWGMATMGRSATPALRSSVIS